MRRKFFTQTLISLLAMMLFICSTALAADFSKLIILHTNDTHGYDAYGDGHNGMAVVGQIKKDLIADGYQVVLIDAGDIIQGSILANFSQGKAPISFMNASAYDVATLGNHEFDYGQEVLLQRISEASFPFVSANIIVDATGENFIQPSTIIQRDDIKIGVVGMTTPSTKTSSSPKNSRGLTFLADKDLYQAVQKEVNKLRAKGCDVVIALSHLGSTPLDIGSRSEDILENVTGLDFIIDAHDHLEKNAYINNVLQAETGSYTNNIGKITYQDGKWTENLIRFGEVTQQLPAVKQLLDMEESRINQNLGMTIASSQVDLESDMSIHRRVETNTGDFTADALLWQAKKASVIDGYTVDAAIANGGSIRTGLPAGNINRSALLSIFPFDNQIKVLKITGSKLLEIMEAATAINPFPAGSFPQVAGIEYTINTSVPYEKGMAYPNSDFFAPKNPGSRVTITRIAGKDFDINATYSIAMADFLAAGGDTYAGLCMEGAVLEEHDIGYKDVEALENYILEELNGVIDDRYSAPQGRITINK